jgi:hypothetical protein
VCLYSVWRRDSFDRGNSFRRATRCFCFRFEQSDTEENSGGGRGTELEPSPRRSLIPHTAFPQGHYGPNRKSREKNRSGAPAQVLSAGEKFTSNSFQGTRKGALGSAQWEKICRVSAAPGAEAAKRTLSSGWIQARRNGAMPLHPGRQNIIAEQLTCLAFVRATLGRCDLVHLTATTGGRQVLLFSRTCI